jgi:hypothetical protein
MCRLEFHCCRLGNTMADKISHPFYHNITHLTITSDPIGNKGIKKLAYLCLPKLGVLKIENTNLTMDSIKMLRKRTLNTIRDICFANHRHFNYDELFKEFIFFKRNKPHTASLNYNKSSIKGNFSNSK